MKPDTSADLRRRLAFRALDRLTPIDRHIVMSDLEYGAGDLDDVLAEQLEIAATDVAVARTHARAALMAAAGGVLPEATWEAFVSVAAPVSADAADVLIVAEPDVATRALAALREFPGALRGGVARALERGHARVCETISEIVDEIAANRQLSLGAAGSTMDSSAPAPATWDVDLYLPGGGAEPQPLDAVCKSAPTIAADAAGMASLSLELLVDLVASGLPEDASWIAIFELQIDDAEDPDAPAVGFVVPVDVVGESLRLELRATLEGRWPTAAHEALALDGTQLVVTLIAVP